MSGDLHLPRPSTRPSEDGDEYVLVENYEAAVLPAHILIIYAGFQTDFASIPRLAWMTIGHPAMPRFQASALIHDALYAAELVSRQGADDLFHSCLLGDGVPRFKAWRMWAAVRLFGGFAWRRHTAASVATARRYCRLISCL